MRIKRLALAVSAVCLLCSGQARAQEPGPGDTLLLRVSSPISHIEEAEGYLRIETSVEVGKARDADEPLACFEKAQESGLTAYGAVQLCGGIPVELHKQVYGDRKGMPPLLQ